MSTEEVTASFHAAETKIMAAMEEAQNLLHALSKEVARLTAEQDRLEKAVAPLQASIVALNAERNGLQADVHKAHEDSRKARQAEAAATQEFRAKLTADTDAYKVECARQVREATERRDLALKAATDAERMKAQKEKELEAFKAGLFTGAGKA